MIQQFHFWVHITNNSKQDFKEIFAPPQVHCSIIHNNLRVKAAQMSTHRYGKWTENVVYT